MNIEKTQRGFDHSSFVDRYGHKCSIQKSSLATEDAIWLGIDEADPKILSNDNGWIAYELPSEVFLTTRMHLTKDMVRDLLPTLQRFADTGELT